MNRISCLLLLAVVTSLMVTLDTAAIDPPVEMIRVDAGSSYRHVDASFGNSVAMSSRGDYFVVGASYEDINVDADPALEEHVGAVYVYHHNGTTWTGPIRLTATDGAEWDHFGASVDISADGSCIIVGAHQKCPNFGSSGTTNCDPGRAYVFSYSGSSWSQDDILTGNGTVNGALFGCSVGIDSDGNTVIVGAKYDGNPDAILSEKKRGEVYVFTNDTSGWSEQENIVANPWAVGDIFGASVDINDAGDYVVIGARECVCAGVNEAGAAYTYYRDGSNWLFDEKICSDDPDAADWFGFDVAMDADGETIVVGARKADVDHSDDGSAEIYSLGSGSWSHSATLAAGNGAEGDNFGRAVAISSEGTSILVGAALTDLLMVGFDVGTAYYFSYDSSSQAWPEEEDFRINAEDKAADDWYGWDLCMSGNGKYGVMGAPRDDVSGDVNAGSAYVVRLTQEASP